MYKDKTVCVVVPAYNEEKLIGSVLESLPKYVDKVVVVDDHSRDKTAEVVNSCKRTLGEHLVLISHGKNQGVGGAIATGYKWAQDNNFDVAVVMAGDGQMDPDDLPAILDPVVEDNADYSKGNRLFTGEAYEKIPKTRYFGNAVLSLFTKIVSGYWHVADSQAGYTAINKKALHVINWDDMYKRYGQPNDLLVRLNVYNFRVQDVPVRPVYNIGERSGISVPKVSFTMSWLLLRLFVWRLGQKYVIRDFHPLVFFYLMGFALAPCGFLFGLYLVCLRILYHPVSATSALFAAFLFITGLQSLFFAMWFDMEYNKELK